MMDTWVGVSHEVEALSRSDTKQCGRHDGYISFSLPHRLIHLVCYKFNRTSILKSSRTEVSLAFRVKDYHMSLTSRVFTLCQLRWIHKAIAVSQTWGNVSKVSFPENCKVHTSDECIAKVSVRRWWWARQWVVKCLLKLTGEFCLVVFCNLIKKVLFKQQ